MGTPDDFRRMLEAFEERNASMASHEETMERLVESVTSLALSVQILRDEVARRPTKGQIDRKRRVSFATICGLIVLTAGLGGLNTDHCGPGARAEGSIVALSHGVRDPQRLADAGYPKNAPICDTLVPISGHSRMPYPNGWTWLGVGLYLTLGLGLFAYSRGPYEDEQSGAKK